MSDLAYQRLVDLWEAVYGDKPSVVAGPRLTAQILIQCLPAAGPYRLGNQQPSSPSDVLTLRKAIEQAL